MPQPLAGEWQSWDTKSGLTSQAIILNHSVILAVSMCYKISEQRRSIQLPVMVEIFSLCAAHGSSHKLHVASEHLKRGQND